MDFGFYENIPYKYNAVLGMTAIVSWLGVSNMFGGLVYYWILTQKLTVISRTTVQRLTSLEKDTNEVNVSVN